MNQRQAIQQVTDVAVWARERTTHPGHANDSCPACNHWRDLADAADDLAVMIERDTFRTTSG